MSGATVSDKLGLSRAGVWKHVEQLRKMGYAIEAIPSKGYRLVSVPDRLSSLELTPLLDTREFGRSIVYEPCVASTNSVAFKRAIDGAPHGEVVIADEQTAGRGRRGRSWVSPPGCNVYLSVVLRPEIDPARAPELTLLTAVAVAETLREAGVRASIKWPNDLLVDGKKVGGILTELSADVDRTAFVIVGIGINVNSSVDAFPVDVAQFATSLQMARGGEQVPRALLTAALLTKLETWFDTWTDEGFEPVRVAWKSLSATLGHEVLVRNDAREVRGLAIDIDATGALLLECGGAVERIVSGDIELPRAKM